MSGVSSAESTAAPPNEETPKKKKQKVLGKDYNLFRNCQFEWTVGNVDLENQSPVRSWTSCKRSSTTDDDPFAGCRFDLWDTKALSLMNEEDESVFLQWETSIATPHGFLVPTTERLEITMAATTHDELQPDTEQLDFCKRMVVDHATILPDILFEMWLQVIEKDGKPLGMAGIWQPDERTFEHVKGDWEKVTKEDFMSQMETVNHMFVLQASSKLGLPASKVQGPVAVITFESKLTTDHGGFVATDGRKCLAHGLSGDIEG